MDVRDVNLNLLVALKALLDEGHVGRAAGRIHITQSGMSKNLAQLRAVFGDPLFVRAGNRLTPTDRALGLKEALDGVLDGVGALLAETAFSPASCRRTFTLALTDYVAQHILPGVARQVFGEATGVGLVAVPWEPSRLEDLASGKLDMATCIVDETPPWVVRRRIDEDDFVCCLRRGHPLEGRLTLEAYVAAPHAAITIGGDKVKVIDRELASRGLRRDVRLHVPYYAPALEIVSRTDLVVTMPRHIARNIAGRFGLKTEELPLPVERFEYSLLWHTRHETDPAHRWLREKLFGELRDSLYSH